MANDISAAIIKAYLTLVREGKKGIKDVPAKYREPVEEAANTGALGE